jgi:hypothetical protein
MHPKTSEDDLWSSPTATSVPSISQAGERLAKVVGRCSARACGTHIELRKRVPDGRSACGTLTFQLRQLPLPDDDHSLEHTGRPIRLAFGRPSTARRCGGSRRVGTRAVSSADMSAASRALPRLLGQRRALRHVLGPHLEVIDGGLPWAPVIRPGVSQLPTHRRRLDHPAGPHLPNLLLVHPHLTRAPG